MKVTLLNYTPLDICSQAIRTCWQSFDKSDNGGVKDLALINRVGNELKHSSTLEHLYYNFYIEDISRACLQELARHRIASLSVKSSRYTLKELNSIDLDTTENWEDLASKYIKLKEDIKEYQIQQFKLLVKAVHKCKSNDIAKYCMPESYLTSLSWSINARSLQNFLNLRTSKAALEEIRELAYAVYGELPKSHKFVFKDSLYQTKE
ncbi:FAD-dependent thymidylate synthase [Campylobacter fetus]|uniref:FAD-dependent thymidylate synthase n=1 Tax=Campylobacter fetus TaxID=196 RepID=UPI000FCB9A24|nr:FAD-dependent thymidylate synthase [Campylobacter fetus]RUT50971.1 thymidylate synthase (FAD) [Campylobacter fetus]RUT51699.1 thymidylate synthase (FAD) [Campylobacter fetus]